MFRVIPMGFHMIRIPRCGMSTFSRSLFTVCTSIRPVYLEPPTFSICLGRYCLQNISKSFPFTHRIPYLPLHPLCQHLLCAFQIGHHHCGLIIIICLLNWPEFNDPTLMRAGKSKMLPKQSWFSITTNKNQINFRSPFVYKQKSRQGLKSFNFVCGFAADV